MRSRRVHREGGDGAGGQSGGKAVRSETGVQRGGPDLVRGVEGVAGVPPPGQRPGGDGAELAQSGDGAVEGGSVFVVQIGHGDQDLPTLPLDWLPLMIAFAMFISPFLLKNPA